MSFSPENPWIRERETILCGWKPDYNRGFINNMNMNFSVDWYSFSDRQIKEYARMMKSFGYTGIQVTDGCNNWRWYSSWEPVHDRFKKLADALHEEGMKFTFWVWAARFTHHGWVDPDVRYTAADGGSAYDDPQVFACFDRYYDIYADMAPYSDRLILHFFDPGALRNYSDIFRFCRLIEGKFRKVNPNVQMGIDTWSAPDDFPQAVVNSGLKDYMFMELPSHGDWSAEERRAFRKGVRDAGSPLGVWSWYTADMEIDQSAKMVVNAHVMKDVCNRTREEGDCVKVPDYWSEIDSYHVMNLFSLYCAGQLLIDPDRDPDELVHEIAYRIYSDRHGAAVERALRLIQDARSGKRWEDYWWKGDARKLIFDPDDIIARAEKSMAEIAEVAKDRGYTTTQPLPVSPATLAELMLPHLEQILIYARFRKDMFGLEKMLEDGADKEALFAELDRIWEPVPDFNTVVGVWGQPESRMQLNYVRNFCARAGIDVPKKPLMRHLLKKRYYECLVSKAKTDGRTVFSHRYYEGSLPFKAEEGWIFDELEAEGLIRQHEDGNIELLHAEAYKYR
jgi:sugar phosphate isomerase/epimerase